MSVLEPGTSLFLYQKNKNKYLEIAQNLPLRYHYKKLPLTRGDKNADLTSLLE